MASRRRYGLPPGVTHRPDTGRFRYRYTDLAGRRRSVELKADTPDAAWREWTEHQNTADGGFGITTNWTVTAWRAEWLDTKRRTVEAKTWVNYERLTQILADEYGPLRLTELDGHHLDRIYNQLRDRGLSPLSVRNYHAAFRTMLRAAVRKRIIPRSPHEETERIATAKKQDRPVWDAAAVNRFLTHTAGHRLHPYFLLALDTGVRRGELMAWTWGDFNGRTLTVNARVTVANGRQVKLASTKTGRARTVWLADTTVAYLNRHRARQREALFAQGITSSDDIRLVSTPRGKPYSPGYVTHQWEIAVKASGVEPYIPLGQARHTWATLAMQSGVTVSVIADRLGNSTDVVMRHYAQTTEQQQRAAANVLRDARIGGSG